MILKMFVIHDTAVKTFVSPHFCRTMAEAERGFVQAVNNSENGNLYKNPEHFGLYCVGEYDDETGLVQPLSQPQSVITAIQAKQT